MFSCLVCGAALAGDPLAGGATACSACRRRHVVHRFPAAEVTTAPVGSVGSDAAAGEAGCFFHPRRRAAVPCDDCGRFLCPLCDIEIAGRHLCPSCLEGGRRKGTVAVLDTERVRYDKIALALVTWPLITFYFTLITAPAALFLVVRHWSRPCSLVHRTGLRFLTAAVLAVLEIAGMITFIVYLVAHWPKAGPS